jgi:hypothetical protein
MEILLRQLLSSRIRLNDADVLSTGLQLQKKDLFFNGGGLAVHSPRRKTCLLRAFYFVDLWLGPLVVFIAKRVWDEVLLSTFVEEPAACKEQLISEWNLSEFMWIGVQVEFLCLQAYPP